MLKQIIAHWVLFICMIAGIGLQIIVLTLTLENTLVMTALIVGLCFSAFAIKNQIEEMKEELII